MTRTLLLTLLITLASGAGCATAHLGPDTGVRTRGAFAAQRASEPVRAPAFGAEDARATLAARRGDKGKAGEGGGVQSIGLASVPLMLGGAAGGSSGGAGWQGSQSPISLEAK